MDNGGLEGIEPGRTRKNSSSCARSPERSVSATTSSPLVPDKPITR